MKDDLIKNFRQAAALQKKIQKTCDDIARLERTSNSKISDMVYACSDPKELGELCDSFGLDNKGYRWGWEKAYENSYGGNPNYEMQEWCDVLYHVTIELQMHVEKMATGSPK